VADVTEEMIQAGSTVYLDRWPNLDSSDKRDECLRAIYLAMHNARPLPTDEEVERAARAISQAAYDYMRSIGFSGGWDHDELGRSIARAALIAGR
jgi:hypothetical protein